MNEINKSSIKDRIIRFSKNASTLAHKAFLGEKEINSLINKPINVIKVFIVSIRKFMEDDCLTKASSIAYTTIISLIPTLAVALTIYSAFKGVAGQKEEFFNLIAGFMHEHDLNINIDPILDVISQLIDNAGRIGGIGAAVLVFSATALLRSLEKALNSIYKVKKQRSIFMKIIYYWAVLTLGPILIIAATTVASQLTETFSVPNYNSAQIHNNKIWIAGDHGTLGNSSIDTLKFANISRSKIDFDNQMVFSFDPQSSEFSRNLQKRISHKDYKQKKIIDLQFINNSGWAISSDGLILLTNNNGESWKILKKTGLNFNAIYMHDAHRGYIVGQDSLLMKTEDGGNQWSIIKYREMNIDLLSIRFSGNKGIITCTRSMIYLTEDSGNTWEPILIEEAIRNKRHLRINDSFIIDNDEIILLGDEGIILRTEDNAHTWDYIGFLNNNYHAVYFFNHKSGMVGGSKGIMLRTDNGGTTWIREDLPTTCVNSILFHKGKLWTFGNEGMFMVSEDMGKTWDGVKGRDIFAFLMRFFAPFVFIWILFFMSYMALPNIKVPFKPAAIGAAFTSTVWVIFILTFIAYTRAFATGTFAIYGALAAIPLFLLMVYSSAVIILFGAEVSYTLMYPASYKTLKKDPEGLEKIYIYDGINIIMHIYEKFEKGNGGTSISELLKITTGSDDETQAFLQIFIDNNIINQDTEGDYFPALSSEKLSIKHIFDLIHSISYIIPPGAKASGVNDWLREIFDNMSNTRGNIIGDSSLKDLINLKS